METPIIVLGRTELCTSYFVKARVCKKNFVMHEYKKGHSPTSMVAEDSCFLYQRD